MFLDDSFCVLRRDIPIPRTLRIHDHVEPLPAVERGGVVLYNAATTPEDCRRGDVRIVAKPFTEIADELGSSGVGDTGGGGEAVKIVSDLPLQGSSAGQTETMVNAIKLYLEQIGGKAGDFTVSYESFDDSTAIGV